MKKLLFLSFTALSIMGSAQILVTESFENATYPGFDATGGVAGQTGTYTGSAACNGTGFIGGVLAGTSDANRTLDLIYTKPSTITANGKKIDIKFSYSMLANSDVNDIGGTMAVAYSTDGGTTYTPIGSTVTFSDITETSCAVFTGTIPESANVNGNFKLRIRAVGTLGSTYSSYIFLDNVSIKQEVTAIPTCATISSPVNGATNVAVRPQLTWNAVTGAEMYKIKVGTTSGASNVYSGTSTTTSFSPLASSAFPQNTTLYASVTPTNALGDATGCQEISFATGANPFTPYCGPLAAKLGVYPISKVQISDMTNNSTLSVAHENFTNKVATVTRGTSYPLTLAGAGVGTNNRFGFTVFIDWNQNGSFADAGEAYFVTSDFAGGAAANGATLTVNKNIAVPATAALGNTRMRVKYQFNTSTTSVRAELSDPCGDVSQGQVEDYTINVQATTLGTSEVGMNKTAEISVYPNPFKDILKISDVKGVKAITVTDVSGRQLKTLKASNEINLSDLGSGLYLITLQMEDGNNKVLKAIKK